MKPPVCRTCGAAEFFHTCKGPAPGAALAQRGLTPALAKPELEPEAEPAEAKPPGPKPKPTTRPRGKRTKPLRA